MSIFLRAEEFGMEQLIFFRNESSGLKAIIAIHDTTLGPALGGTRMKPYATEDEALDDVCNLARAMTYKNSIAGLDLGGGKAVIIGDPQKDKTEGLLRAYGRCIGRLGGSYITSVDSGFNPEDVDIVERETPFAHGGMPKAGRGGTPSPATAYGVFKGMEACMEALGEEPSLAGKKVAVQGLGNVGSVLCQYLSEVGAKLFVSDIMEEKVVKAAEQYGATVISNEEIHKVECDIFSPCGIGGVINKSSIKELNCRVIAGASNNILAEPGLEKDLHQGGILYAPDYVINAGGVIYVAMEKTQYSKEEILSFVARIKDRLREILSRSKKENLPPTIVSNRIAEERIAFVRNALTLRNDFRGNIHVP